MSRDWETTSEWTDQPAAPGRRLGSIGSVPVYVKRGVLGLMAVLGVLVLEAVLGVVVLGNGLATALICGGVLGAIAGVFLHEAAHGVAAKLRGQTVCYAVVSSKAAVVIGKRGETYTAKDLAVIVLAGPLTNAAIATAAAAVGAVIGGNIGLGFAVASGVNVILGLNLVPVYARGTLGGRTPTDGAWFCKALRSARSGAPIPPSEGGSSQSRSARAVGVVPLGRRSVRVPDGRGQEPFRPGRGAQRN